MFNTDTVLISFVFPQWMSFWKIFKVLKFCLFLLITVYEKTLLFFSGEENAKRYFVATQDKELRNKLRKIPGWQKLLTIHTTVINSEKQKRNQIQQSLWVLCLDWRLLVKLFKPCCSTFFSINVNMNIYRYLVNK